MTRVPVRLTSEGQQKFGRGIGQADGLSQAGVDHHHVACLAEGDGDAYATPRASETLPRLQGSSAWRRRADRLGLLSVAALGAALAVSYLTGGSALALELQDPAETGAIGLARVRRRPYPPGRGGQRRVRTAR